MGIGRQSSVVSRKPRLKRVFLLGAALLVLASSCSASGRKVVVVVANRVLLSDLRNSSLQSISKMLAEGAPGLVSPNCQGFKTERSVLLTAAAGAGCRGGTYVADCFDANETMPNGELAKSAYFSRTGRRAGDGSAVFLGAAQAARENQGLGGLGTTGSLGDAVRKAGKKTCAIGNADIPPDVFDRSVAVLAADSNGLVDCGWLPPPDSDSSGIAASRISTGLLLSFLLYNHDLIVYNFGETTRLDETRISFSDEAFAKQWADALAKLDQLIGELMEYADKQDVSIVLVSFSPPKAPRWTDLTPIVVYPSSKKALLTSATTRTPGLIAASDLAPTVLKIMGVACPAAVTGRAATASARSDKFRTLETLAQKVALRRILEFPMLWTIAIIGIISCTLSAISAGFGVMRRARKALRIGLLIGVASPLGMLVASAAPGGAAGYALATALAVVCALAVGWIAGERTLRRCIVEGNVCPSAVPVVIIFWATAVCVLIDSAFGGTLCKFSLPSFYQISGFRFYGIGNEYAGILISMAALALLFSGKTFRHRVVVPLGLVITAFFGIGSLGANYGETVTAVVTFGLLWMAIRRGGFRARHAVMWCVIGVIVSVAFAIADWKLAGGHGTHASRTGAAASAAGSAFWTDLIGRKVLMNMKLTFSNTAEQVFLGFLPFIGLWLWKIQGRVKSLFTDDKSMLAGLQAVSVGAAAGYVGNDSGIVVASIMVAMTVVILLYSLLEANSRTQEV